MLNNIQIVLIATSHPGNIGSAARAMKNMGLSQLSLVSPKDYPNVKATARASGADDILENAVICQTLEEAIAGATLVIGASARDRRLTWPELNPKQMAELVREKSANSDTRIAILFGRENNGLSNEELELCHYLVQIPANPVYSSLNLAAAVQVLAYELRMVYLQSVAESHDRNISSAKKANELDSPLAKGDAMNHMYEHMQSVLVRLEFINEQQPAKLVRRIKRLFNRAQMEEKEVQIIRGMMSAIEKMLDQKE